MAGGGAGISGRAAAERGATTATVMRVARRARRHRWKRRSSTRCCRASPRPSRQPLQLLPTVLAPPRPPGHRACLEGKLRSGDCRPRHARELSEVVALRYYGYHREAGRGRTDAGKGGKTPETDVTTPTGRSPPPPPRTRPPPGRSGGSGRRPPAASGPPPRPPWPPRRRT